MGFTRRRYWTTPSRYFLAVALGTTLVVGGVLFSPIPVPGSTPPPDSFPAWTEYRLPDVDTSQAHPPSLAPVPDSDHAADIILQSDDGNQTAAADSLPNPLPPLALFSTPWPISPSAPASMDYHIPTDTIPFGQQTKPFALDTTAAGRLRAGLTADSLRGLGVRDTTRRDTTGTRRKWVYSDTTYVVDLDSTSRMRQWNRTWRDSAVVRLFPDRAYPLTLTGHPVSYRREVTLDTSGSTVSFRERYIGADVKTPVVVPLKEYIERRRAYEQFRLFADEARKGKALGPRNDLGELMSNITQISIPIPANPVMSIFGKPVINLNISGAVDIKAGFRSTKSDQMTLSALDQVRNEPDFSQEVQVNVNGTIGDKLNILADWNTRRTFEYENQLKIKYTGYDDEIVQSVEAGNVSLSTPTSFIGSSQALFGIKAKMQFGPLSLTTLASQKKGQIKEVNVSGGSSEQTFEFHAYEYSINHYFVDATYNDTARYNAYYQRPTPIVNQNSQIVEAEVWVTNPSNIPDPLQRQAIAWIDLPDKNSQSGGNYSSLYRDSTGVPGKVENGVFIRLDPSQYELDGNGYLGEVSLNTNVGDQQIVAIAYRTFDGRQFGEFTRDVSSNTGATLVLKMVKPKNLIANGPSYKEAWNLLLKNVYPIPGVGRNLKKSGFKLDIYRVVPGQSDQNSILNQPLLRVFGLDTYTGDDNATRAPDGTFDFRPGFTISQQRAEIIFPSLRPFDDGIKSYFTAANQQLPDSSYYYPLVYDTTQTFAQQSDRNRYAIRGKATGEASSKFQLGFNIVEGSVQVLLNGGALTPNVDYTVDYIVGEVVIKNAAALVPGANLQIKFEQNDLFQLASKTLLGVRGDLNLGPQTAFGFTLMNLNQQTLSDKVRLGEEPNTNTILGVDGGTTFNLPFLTRALDALPLLQTKEPSSLKVTGEAAYMIPDPNTKKSTIASDNSQGVAYVDDFEGARRTIPVGIGYNAWTLSGPLADRISINEFGVADTAMNFKAKMIWYNLLPTNVALTDIYPRKVPGNAANNRATVLDLKYIPTMRGTYNFSNPPQNTLTRNWSGIMKPLSVSAINLLKENVNYLELWVYVNKAPIDTTAKMIIDLGSISERAVPNGRNGQTSNSPNSEALVFTQSPTAAVLNGADLGVDMYSDADEQALHPGLGSDPAGDDYAFNNSDPHEDFMHINGTEGNINGPGGRIPDTEDLNGNGVVDLANSYFEYELSLDTTARNPEMVGLATRIDGSHTGWAQFRIPIGGYRRTVGTPTQENIEFVRVAFKDVTDTLSIRIGDFSLVGNQWQKLEAEKSDSLFSIAVVSVEDNPNYQSPPGVIREQDKTQPDQKILANEQSLAVQVKGLPDGQSREAVKYFTYKALDLINYRTMKMYVHMDPRFQYKDLSNYDAAVIFRFGLDTLNYYEYRAPLRPDLANPDPNARYWTEVTIDFSELTAIKQTRDSANALSQPHFVSGGPPGATYRVLGYPSLTQIVFLSVGVENPLGIGTQLPLVGEVWYDELRLVAVDDTHGWAYRFDTQLKLADLGSVSFNYSRVDPFFHSLEERFGSRQLSTNWALSTAFQLEKFLPESWAGTTIPLSYSHTESRIQPRYLANSDILVSQAATEAHDVAIREGLTEQQATATADSIVTTSESKHVSDTYALPNIHIAIPTSAWYVRDTFNRLSFGFTYTKSTDRSPSIINSTAWSWRANMGYAITFPADAYVLPFRSLFDGVWGLDEFKGLKIFYAPVNFTWSFTATRSRSNSLQRAPGASEIISRNFTASRGFGFAWKFSEGGILSPSLDYGLQVESSLLDFELDQNDQPRTFSQILKQIFFSDKLVNFGQDTRYGQHTQFNTKPNIPNILNIKKYLDVTFSYGVDYSWSNQLIQGDLGKSAGFNNNINSAVTLRLKQLFDPLFEDAAASGAAPALRGRRGAETNAVPDTTHRAADTTAQGSKKLSAQLKTLVRTFIKTPFLDYDNISISFTQANNAQASGVVGGTGFVNFWGRMPFFQSSLPENGPSRLFQLGLISDPSGRLTNFGVRPGFPFFGWDLDPGPRASGGVINNSYRQTNRLTFKTSRGLWEGAHLDLNWSVGWTYSRTQSLAVTDSISRIPILQVSQSAGSVDRSFLTFPNVLFLGLFKTSLKDVSKRYSDLKANGDASLSDDQKLAKAFEQGFEALPILSKLFGQFYPRVNWSLRWDGLEKIPMFSGFVSRLSLDHSYNSNFTRQFEYVQGLTGERTDAQRVMYGFAPLIGLNFTFKELAKGSFGANFRYNTNTSYDLALSSRNIVEALNQEISVTGSYSRKGFEIPFFGLALQNDVDISLSYSVSVSTRRTYDTSQLDVDVTGTPLEGSTRTVLEPRIKYVLSSRVTAAIYYRYTKVQPDDNGSRIPGTTTNEAGLDIHIAIP